ncbi:hypothetical protein PanWU01x14_080650 [Parasponia andersonii]|uniref:Uncharacterized protein n=1 Tax=Parasponia andersonii TaxID=3476 RepID=A0A2P5DAS7_PARAD|nr:hypothetical protein PanWU01x14_080650 [Parasponia andersonii]
MSRISQMLDLGNLSFSAPLTLTHCLNLKSLTNPLPDPNSLNYVKAIRGQVKNGIGIRKASNAKTMEDHIRAWVNRKNESGLPKSRCHFPFLVDAKKMV